MCREVTAQFHLSIPLRVALLELAGAQERKAGFGRGLRATSRAPVRHADRGFFTNSVSRECRRRSFRRPRAVDQWAFARYSAECRAQDCWCVDEHLNQDTQQSVHKKNTCGQEQRERLLDTPPCNATLA